MKVSLRASVLAVLVVAINLMTIAPAQAAGSCHNINAKGQGQDLGNGVTNAQIIGGGLLHGTTVGHFTVTGLSGALASIAGTVAFSANKATLTVAVAGTFDLSTGAFNASGPVSASTGKLAGATGSVSFAGTENLGNGSFVEDIDGNICLP
jgi:hypothetical protein